MLIDMNNSKSTGMDGFTADFLKILLGRLRKVHFKVCKLCIQKRFSLSKAKSRYYNMYSKTNKPHQFLNNWRPIALLNVIYKLMSSVIANRLKSVSNKLINNNHKGFISGRYIGENIRTVYDILFETKQQNIPGLLVSVDFQQAFDTVWWKFMDKTLDYFNFGPSIKKWIQLFETGEQ